jgi:Fic family protein
MDQLYTYKQTPAINKLITRIEVAKQVIGLLPQLPNVEKNLRRQSLLKSSLYSARIEGNTLELSEVDTGTSSKLKEKKEVLNIVHTLEWIHSSRFPKIVTIDTLLTLHQRVLNNLSQEAGKFRKEPTAIFNAAGIAVYMTPPPAHLPYLVDQLIAYIASSKDHPAVTASKAHFMFEKIHPFVDGNGRVGRLLSTGILKNADLALHGVVSIEEYLNEHRLAYYDLLAETGQDITGFIEFSLEALALSAEETIETLKNSKEEKPEDSLLPRRHEILEIIREQQLCSFNRIKRRFSKIPDSSLHYDLQALMKKNFIKKRGSTRGVLYIPSSKN